MSKNLNDEYMVKFREFELAIKDATKFGSVLEYEKCMSSVDSSKMQICRILRNHLAHNNDKDFISVTPGMMQFIDDQIFKIKSASGLLKDFMITSAKYCFVDENTPVVDAALVMTKKKRKCSVVLNKKGEPIGVISTDVISGLVGEGLVTKTLKVGKILNKLETDRKFYDGFTKDTPMSSVENEIEKSNAIIIVKGTGNKIIGIYNA